MKGRTLVPGHKAHREGFTLGQDDRVALYELARHMGISKSAVVREGIYLLARYPQLRRADHTQRNGKGVYSG